MHRVELKVIINMCDWQWVLNVPNAPCGVESRPRQTQKALSSLFLMHRVELKDARDFADQSPQSVEFLMYRVELKVLSSAVFVCTSI